MWEQKKPNNFPLSKFSQRRMKLKPARYRLSVASIARSIAASMCTLMLLFSTPIYAEFECPAGKYHIVGEVCVGCAEGKYTDQPNTLTVCKPCLKGKYNDQQEQETCKPCPRGEYTDGPAKTECKECTPGYYNDQSEQIICKRCPSGREGHYPRATIMTNCTTCIKGHYRSLEMLPTTCPQCEGGRYAHSNASGCIPCKENFYCVSGIRHPCPVGKDSKGELERESQNECEDCEIGYYCPGEGNPTLPCPPGKFGKTGISISRGSQAASCSTCPRGHYCSGAASKIPCPSGKYGEELSWTNVSQCEACTSGYFCTGTTGSRSACVAGKYGNQTSQSAETSCKNCTRGHFCSGGGQDIQPCTPGKYGKTGDINRVDETTSCDDCPRGCFCRGTTHNESCMEGTYTNLTKQSKCKACQSGYYNFKRGQTKCIQCERGYFCENATQRRACFPGTFAAHTGQKNCTACATGRYNQQKAKADCKDCKKGYFCPNATTMNACPKGTYGSRKFLLNCTSCAAGRYNMRTARTECKDCEKGYFCPTPTEKFPCSKGTYGGQSLQTENCSVCALGRYNMQIAQADCIDCEMGYFCPNVTTKIPCPKGTYGDQSMQISNCTECVAGRYNLQNTQTTCNDCEAGAYCANTTSKRFCPKGRYGNETKKTSETAACIGCELGYVCEGADSHYTCDKGKYGNRKLAFDSAFHCSVCNLSYYCTSGIQHKCGPSKYTKFPGVSTILGCIDCERGAYCPDEMIPQACPNGKYNAQTGQVSSSACKNCTAGRYSNSKERGGQENGHATVVNNEENPNQYKCSCANQKPLSFMKSCKSTDVNCCPDISDNDPTKKWIKKTNSIHGGSVLSFYSVIKGGSATQKDTYMNSSIWAASNARDGSGSLYASTEETSDPWWKLTFNSPQNITRVEITNRGECCGEKLNGARVRVYTTAKTWWTCGEKISEAKTGDAHIRDCDVGDHQVTVVEVSISGADKMLSLTEVVVANRDRDAMKYESITTERQVTLVEGIVRWNRSIPPLNIYVRVKRNGIYRNVPGLSNGRLILFSYGRSVSTSGGQLSYSSGNVWRNYAQVALDGKVKSFIASIDWKDQGSGNRAGKIFIRVKRNGAYRSRFDLFGLASHSRGKSTNLDGTALIADQQIDDIWEVWAAAHHSKGYSATSFSGHELYIYSFTIQITYEYGSKLSKPSANSESESNSSAKSTYEISSGPLLADQEIGDIWEIWTSCQVVNKISCGINSFDMTILYQQVPEPVCYIAANVGGTKEICHGSCAAGRYGRPGETNKQCTGACAAGRYGYIRQTTPQCNGACRSGRPGRYGDKGQTTQNCSGNCNAGRYSGNGGESTPACTQKCERGYFCGAAPGSLKQQVNGDNEQIKVKYDNVITSIKLEYRSQSCEYWPPPTPVRLKRSLHGIEVATYECTPPPNLLQWTVYTGIEDVQVGDRVRYRWRSGVVTAKRSSWFSYENALGKQSHYQVPQPNHKLKTRALLTYSAPAFQTPSSWEHALCEFTCDITAFFTSQRRNEFPNMLSPDNQLSKARKDDVIAWHQRSWKVVSAMIQYHYNAPCPAGTYSNQTGLSTAEQCEKCPQGTYSPYIGQTSKAACKPCPVSTYGSKRGLKYDGKKPFDNLDGGCRSCSPGKISNVTAQINNTACKICPVGKYSDTVCKACEKGRYGNIKGLNHCIACPEGKYNPLQQSNSSSACQNCASGRHGDKMTARPIPCEFCPIGTYSSASGAASITNCTGCRPGRYSSVPNKNCAFECNQGKFSFSGSTCLDCNQGRYQNLSNQFECKPCPGGRTLAEEIGPYTQCSETCHVGRYANPGKRECTICPAGRFAGSQGEASCAVCPAGTISDDTEQSQCQQCAVRTSMHDVDIPNLLCANNIKYKCPAVSWLATENAIGVFLDKQCNHPAWYFTDDDPFFIPPTDDYGSYFGDAIKFRVDNNGRISPYLVKPLDFEHINKLNQIFSRCSNKFLTIPNYFYPVDPNSTKCQANHESSVMADQNLHVTNSKPHNIAAMVCNVKIAVKSPQWNTSTKVQSFMHRPWSHGPFVPSDYAARKEFNLNGVNHSFLTIEAEFETVNAVGVRILADGSEVWSKEIINVSTFEWVPINSAGENAIRLNQSHVYSASNSTTSQNRKDEKQLQLPIPHSKIRISGTVTAKNPYHNPYKRTNARILVDGQEFWYKYGPYDGSQCGGNWDGPTSHCIGCIATPASLRSATKIGMSEEVAEGGIKSLSVRVSWTRFPIDTQLVLRLFMADQYVGEALDFAIDLRSIGIWTATSARADLRRGYSWIVDKARKGAHFELWVLPCSDPSILSILDEYDALNTNSCAHTNGGPALNMSDMTMTNFRRDCNSNFIAETNHFESNIGLQFQSEGGSFLFSNVVLEAFGPVAPTCNKVDGPSRVRCHVTQAPQASTGIGAPAIRIFTVWNYTTPVWSDKTYLFNRPNLNQFTPGNFDYFIQSSVKHAVDKIPYYFTVYGDATVVILGEASMNVLGNLNDWVECSDQVQTSVIWLDECKTKRFTFNETANITLTGSSKLAVFIKYDDPPPSAVLYNVPPHKQNITKDFCKIALSNKSEFSKRPQVFSFAATDELGSSNLKTAGYSIETIRKAAAGLTQRLGGLNATELQNVLVANQQSTSGNTAEMRAQLAILVTENK